LKIIVILIDFKIFLLKRLSF